MRSRGNKNSEGENASEPNESSYVEPQAQYMPEMNMLIDSKNPTTEGCVPSPSNKRLDTIESDISALNLSPKSKANLKLRKLIK
jgi:hypothetical protein